MSAVTIEHLVKRYGAATAVADVSLQVQAGEFVALLGPSGCGKTTTLRMVAGFIEPTEGRIDIGGRDVTHLPPYKRNTGLVFQSYALFPHMSEAQNVGFGLEMRPGGQGRPRCADSPGLGSGAAGAIMPTACRGNCRAGSNSA